MRIQPRWRRAVARFAAGVLAVGATAATAPITTVTVHASAPMAIQAATYRGTGVMAGQGNPSFVDSIHDATAGDVGNATTAKGGSGTGTPDPAGIATSTTGTQGGFAGLTHRDQRLAGSPTTKWDYTNTQFSLEPPDQGLCVGNGYVLEGVNTAFQIFNTQGAPLTNPMAYNQFYGIQPEFNRHTGDVGDFVSDPKCNFDVASQRWFMTILQIDPPGLCNAPNFAVIPCPGSRAHTFLSVSTDANPLHSWKLYSIDATDDGLNGTPNNQVTDGHGHVLINCPCFGDQPLLGVNADAVVITTNEYGAATLANTNPRNPEVGGQVYAISKSSLINSTGGAINVVHINAGAFAMHGGECCAPFDSLQPATTVTGTGQPRGVEYMLSSFTNHPGVVSGINVWALTGTDTINRTHPDLDLQRKALRSESYAFDLPAAAPGLGSLVVDQKDGPRVIGSITGEGLPQVNANDVRMNQVVYAGGKLWGAVNTALKAGPTGAARAGIAYFIVRPSIEDGELGAEMAHQGYVSVAGNSVVFPSVAVNRDGNGIIAFSLLGLDYYPSAAYVRINSEGVRGKVVISAAGTGADDGFTGYPSQTGGGAPVGRWGDYSAAVAMPDGSIWAANEWIPSTPRTILANWGTYITHIPAASGDNGGGGGGDGGGNN